MKDLVCFLIEITSNFKRFVLLLLRFHFTCCFNDREALRHAVYAFLTYSIFLSNNYYLKRMFFGRPTLIICHHKAVCKEKFFPYIIFLWVHTIFLSCIDIWTLNRLFMAIFSNRIRLNCNVFLKTFICFLNYR